jgi:hypothetical protein
LGPILNIGELSKPTTFNTDSKQSSESSQKYTSISKSSDESGESYKRESTVASVSNLGVVGPRGQTPGGNDPKEEISTSEVAKKNFE